MVYVVKMNGEREEFREDKIISTAIRAGAPESLAEEIARVIKKRAYDGITTKEILKMVKEELKKHDPHLARIYTLKDAIASLNPDIHEFEYYVASLFRLRGYRVKRSPEPKPEGKCVEHEIDVLAEKNNKIIIVECKHHYRERTFTGLDVVMRQHARLIDLREGWDLGKKNAINPSEAWVTTNTKFSDHAIRYAKCRGIKLLSWRFPEGHSFADWANEMKAYPLTVISMPLRDREALIPFGIWNVVDFMNADDDTLKRAGLKESAIKNYRKRVLAISQLLNG